MYGCNYDTRDGYCIRDYIHVVDIAEAHVLALRYLLDNDVGVQSFNLGTGKGHSVMEVIKAVEKVTGEKIDYRIISRRAGDPPQLVAGVTGAIKTLNWKPVRPNVMEQIKDAWKWHKNYYD